MRLGYLSKFLGKYAFGSLAVVLVFGNFVACGSQFYKVSLEHDFEHRNLKTQNEQMNDKTATTYGIHNQRGWQNLPIPIVFSQDMNITQKTHFLAAVKTWEWATGKKLVDVRGTHQGVTGDSFDDLYSSLNDDFNGQYLDKDWKKTGKPEYVLATTIWNLDTQNAIHSSDIRFNYENYVIGDSLQLRAEDNRQVVDMLSLTLHEFGHLLGLAHVDSEVDRLSIMAPSLFIGPGLTSRNISYGDIERIQTIYGCAGVACENDKLEAMLNNPELEEWILQSAQLWIEKGEGLSPDIAFNEGSL